MVRFVEPLILPMLGFAAGAMIFLVIVEQIPNALDDRHPVEIAGAFVVGFSLMVLVQVVLRAQLARQRPVRGLADFAQANVHIGALRVA